MTLASKTLRRIEMTLWVIGITLLGSAFAATLDRWQYQSQQERALFDHGGPAPVSLESKATGRPEPSAASRSDQLAEAPASAEETAPRAAAGSIAPADPNPPHRAQRGTSTPTAFGRLEIPRLGVSAIVKIGDDDATLDRAVGLVPESARPGQVGNVVLAGHRDTFFRPLRDIRIGDRIRMAVPDRTYTYKVESVMVVSPDDTNVLRSKGREELTLVTCFPFRYVGPSPDRFIVSATRVR
jgi:sortase A